MIIDFEWFVCWIIFNIPSTFNQPKHDYNCNLDYEDKFNSLMHKILLFDEKYLDIDREYYEQSYSHYFD